MLKLKEEDPSGTATSPCQYLEHIGFLPTSPTLPALLAHLHHPSVRAAATLSQIISNVVRVRIGARRLCIRSILCTSPGQAGRHPVSTSHRPAQHRERNQESGEEVCGPQQPRQDIGSTAIDQRRLRSPQASIPLRIFALFLFCLSLISTRGHCRIVQAPSSCIRSWSSQRAVWCFVIMR